MSLWSVVIAVFLLMIAESALAVEVNGVIRGQVNYTGTVPAAEPLKIGGDRFCEEMSKKSSLLREDVLVNPNKTLKNVVVWVASGGPDSFKPQAGTPQKATLTQQGCTFFPHVLAVQVGQPLELSNMDPTIHNINAIPKQNRRFNMAMIGGKTAPQIIAFDKPEVAVKLKCDIHPWMVAWVAVFDHPLFAISGDDGTFEITGLPPGEYVLQTWHEKFGGTRAEVLVKESDSAEVIFTYTDSGTASGSQTDSNAASTVQNTVSP